MAYVVPAMPLFTQVWHNYDPAVSAYASPDANTPCNLSPGKRTFNSFIAPATTFMSITCYPFPMELLVPALSDYRPTSAGVLPDVIECPKNSLRFYVVAYVDDIGKGFANEHRLVMMYRFLQDAVFIDGTFPVPVPLP